MTSTLTDNLRQNCGVLLLGATGKLGQMLRRNWPPKPTLSAQSRQVDNDFITFDLILEPDLAVQAMRGKRCVICLSGVTPARVDAQDDVYSRNTDLAIAAIKAAAQANVNHVFLASSAAVYGAAQGVQKETSTPCPAAPYGVAKLDMEQAALSYAQQVGQPATALRIGNVAGADAILGNWRAGMQLDRMANGKTPQRSYIGPKTLTRVLTSLCQVNDLPDILNIATPGAVEMGALLDAADKPWTPRPAPEGVIERVELCTERLERYVNFASQDSTAASMVAEWRADQVLGQDGA